ncbi:hypothetical protein Tco_0961189 [Tanacetum coccineum]
MMNLTTLSLSFWDYALESATRILNMVPTKKVDKTPYELWYGKVPYLLLIGLEYPKETMVTNFYFPPENKIDVARSKRTHRTPDRLCLNVEVKEHSLGDLNEPTSYKSAMLDSESNKWIEAMNAEYHPMMDNMVWSFDLPPGGKTVRASGGNVTFLILYVDDIIIMGNHIPSLQSVNDYLGKCFAMKDLGEAAFILRIKAIDWTWSKCLHG